MSRSNPNYVNTKHLGRVWADEHEATLDLRSTVNPEGEPVLELTVDKGDEMVSVRLGDYGVRELRLVLQKYERSRKR